MWYSAARLSSVSNVRRRLWLVILIAAVLLAPVVWYLGSPLVINRTVDEPFPAVSGPGQPVSP